MRDQLQRVVENEAFKDAGNLTRMLRFVVEEALAGRGDRLKAYTIAVGALDRDASFDPQADSIIRVEMTRLRQKLAQYYIGVGRHDPVRIDIPKGSYAPTWRLAADPRPDAAGTGNALAHRWGRIGERLRAGRATRIVAALAAGGVAAALLFTGVSSHRPEADPAGAEAALDVGGLPTPTGPAVAIAPLVSLSETPADAYFAAGLTEELYTDLVRFHDLRIVARTPEHLMHAGATGRPGWAADYLLEGSVRKDEGRLRVSVKLADVDRSQLIWAQEYDKPLTLGNLIDIEDDIARRVVTTVGQPYGVISTNEIRKVLRRRASTLLSYDCVLRNYHYWANRSEAYHAEIRDCLERSVEQDPTYADAWAILAYAYIDEYRYGFNPRVESERPLRRALDAALRAVKEEPTNPLAHMALASVAFFARNIPLFRAHGEIALTLNPNNTDIAADFGTKLAYAGDWETGIALVRRSMELNPGYPPWYHFPLAYDALRRGEVDEALAEAEKITLPDFYWTYVMLAMIHAERGEMAAAKASVERLLALHPSFPATAAAEFRMWNHSEPSIARYLGALRKAGLPLQPSESTTSTSG